MCYSKRICKVACAVFSFYTVFSRISTRNVFKLLIFANFVSCAPTFFNTKVSFNGLVKYCSVMFSLRRSRGGSVVFTF